MMRSRRRRGLEPRLLSAVEEGPAGGVGVEVVLADTGGVVGGGEHVGGGQRGREVVARLVIDVKVVLVQHLQSEKRVMVQRTDHSMTFSWRTLRRPLMTF